MPDVAIWCTILFINVFNSLRATRLSIGAVVTHLPPTSEVDGSYPEPYVGKMVVSLVYSSGP